MHATKMHFAFLASKSVNTNTDLGRRILAIASRHHAIMEAEMTARSELRAKVLADEKALALAVTRG